MTFRCHVRSKSAGSAPRRVGSSWRLPPAHRTKGSGEGVVDAMHPTVRGARVFAWTALSGSLQLVLRSCFALRSPTHSHFDRQPSRISAATHTCTGWSSLVEIVALWGLVVYGGTQWSKGERIAHRTMRGLSPGNPRDSGVLRSSRSSDRVGAGGSGGNEWVGGPSVRRREGQLCS
jgi:hypothetical protein